MTMAFIPMLAAASAATLPTAPVTITPELLAGLETVPARLEAHGEVHECKGVRLVDVLSRLGAPQGEALRGPALGKAVILRARDGYTVLLSLGELDPSLGNETAVIATQCDGKALDDTVGPYRLVFPGEARPARSARQLETLEIR